MFDKLINVLGGLSVLLDKFISAETNCYLSPYLSPGFDCDTRLLNFLTCDLENLKNLKMNLENFYNNNEVPEDIFDDDTLVELSSRLNSGNYADVVNNNYANITKIFLSIVVYLSKVLQGPNENDIIGENGFINVVSCIDTFDIDNGTLTYKNDAVKFKSLKIESSNNDEYKVVYSINDRGVIRKAPVIIKFRQNIGTVSLGPLHPSPRDRRQKRTDMTAKYYVIAMDFISKFLNFKKNIPLLINKIDRLIVSINEKLLQTDYGDMSKKNENFHFNPSENLKECKQRRLDIPIRADMFGVELEYLGDISPISNFGKEFTYLLNKGWNFERDISVTLEIKSPVMSFEDIQEDVQMCKDLFKAWAENTDSDKSGLHVHVSFDDVFAVNKHPAKKTYLFLTNLAQEIESKLFNDIEVRKNLFKRDFNDYAMSSIDVDEEGINSRYYWVNLRNLNRSAGKTIEFRLGSASLASELDVYVERSYLLAKLFKLAIRDWREKDKPEFNEWKDSFGDTKILKALMPKELLIRFVKLFPAK